MDELLLELALELGAFRERRLIPLVQPDAHGLPLGQRMLGFLRLATGHMKGYPASRYGTPRTKAASTCLRSKIIAQGASVVKYQAMPKSDKQLTEPYVRWIEAEMARRGWKPAKLAQQAKMNQGVISRMLGREGAPDIPTLDRP